MGILWLMPWVMIGKKEFGAWKKKFKPKLLFTKFKIMNSNH